MLAENDYLRTSIGLTEQDIYKIDGFLSNVPDLMSLWSFV